MDARTNTNVLQKECIYENGNLTIEFTHNDTVNKIPGKYYWDIKIYKNAEFLEGKLINGTEIDSYYAEYHLPICEIRQTGDEMIIDENDEPISDAALDAVTSALSKVNNVVNDMSTVNTRLAALENHFPEPNKLALGEDDTTIVIDAYEQFQKIGYMPPFRMVKSINGYLPQMYLDSEGKKTLAFRGRYLLVDSLGQIIDSYCTEIVNNNYTRHSYHMSTLSQRTIEEDDFWSHNLTIFWDVDESIRHPFKFLKLNQAKTVSMFPIGWIDAYTGLFHINGLPGIDSREQQG